MTLNRYRTLPVGWRPFGHIDRCRCNGTEILVGWRRWGLVAHWPAKP